jgi:hypothetical protein
MNADILVGKSEGKWQFGISRSRWEDNIKMDLKEIGCTGFKWLRLRVNTSFSCEHGNEP